MADSKLHFYTEQLSEIESILKVRHRDYSVLSYSCYQPQGAYSDNFGDLIKYLGRIADIKEEKTSDPAERAMQCEKLIEELHKVFTWLE